MRRVFAALAAVVLFTGCAPVDGPLARYRLEQKVWRAQFYERRINISFLQISRQDMQLAIAGFRTALASDPLASPGASSWDPKVVQDIRDIQVASRMALANLYFLSERYTDAGDMYQQTLATGDLSLKGSMEARLGAARALYLSGEITPVMQLCADIFRELSRDDTFSDGRTRIDPAFMSVPVALVRMYHEQGDTARTREFSGLALRFYDRIAAQPADSTGAANDARLGALQVCLAVEDWPAAVSRLNEILALPDLPADVGPGLQLLLGEIYAFPLRDAARAREALQAISREHAGTSYDYASRYDLASLHAQEGNTAAAIDALHAIEVDDAAPASVAARAMLTHARLLEKQGKWDDAYVLYRRVEQSYPNTLAAVEAPLMVTRHYAATGDTALARRTLERAQEYYMSLLDRASPYAGDRMVVQAALQETFMAAGEAEGVAELLGSGPANWDEASSAAGMLRSAEVYATALRDTTKAREMLKKCIERFPETRYANVAQRRLDEWDGRPQ